MPVAATEKAAGGLVAVNVVVKPLALYAVEAPLGLKPLRVAPDPATKPGMDPVPLAARLQVPLTHAIA